jgi:SulP family sulfate permease
LLHWLLHLLLSHLLQRSSCSRLNGYVIVVAELLLFLLPRSFVEFLPNFYYGALMLVFGLEIAADWLVFSCSKFTRTEFILTWVNFVAIMIAVVYLPVSGLEVGIGIGILICAVHFALEYSSVQLKTFTLVSSRSNCVRPITQRKVLELFQANSCVPTFSVPPCGLACPSVSMHAGRSDVLPASECYCACW